MKRWLKLCGLKLKREAKKTKSENVLTDLMIVSSHFRLNIKVYAEEHTLEPKIWLTEWKEERETRETARYFASNNIG